MLPQLLRLSRLPGKPHACPVLPSLGHCVGWVALRSTALKFSVTFLGLDIYGIRALLPLL